MSSKNFAQLALVVLATGVISYQAKANTVLGAAVGAAIGSAIGQHNGGNGAVIGGAIGGALGAEMGRGMEGSYEVRHEHYRAPRTVIIREPQYVYYRPRWRNPHRGRGHHSHHNFHHHH